MLQAVTCCQQGLRLVHTAGRLYAVLSVWPASRNICKAAPWGPHFSPCARPQSHGPRRKERLWRHKMLQLLGRHSQTGKCSLESASPSF